MWKSGKCPTAATTFFPQAVVDEFWVFHRQNWRNPKYEFSTGILSTIHTSCGKVNKEGDMWWSAPPGLVNAGGKMRYRLLQAGIDIGGDVPDVVLQGGVAALECLFHFVDGVKYGGVILAQLLADIRGGKIG